MLIDTDMSGFTHVIDTKHFGNGDLDIDAQVATSTIFASVQGGRSVRP